MAKRRPREAEEAPPEQLTPDERRARRRRDRALAKRGKKPPTGRTSPWRRAAFLGIPAAIIAAIVVVLFFFNPFAAPCISFQPIPAGSGQPDFPLHNTTNFDGTWCPTGVSLVEQIQPYLTIQIEGQTVGIPPTQQATAANPEWPSIGVNSSYPQSHMCDLPILTQPPNPSAGLPDGVIGIESAWPYSYNLSDFFHVWSVSFATADVNTSDPSQPIVYQSNELLGFTSDATHRIQLFVDGSPSTAGPNLVLNTLDYTSTVTPSCLAQKYGTGHQILLSYTTVGPAVRGSGLHPVSLNTSGPDPALYTTMFGGVLQKIGNAPGQASDLDHSQLATLTWLCGRSAGT